MTTFIPKTYTCHPLQNWVLGRSGLEFVRCILTITSQKQADALTLQRRSMRPAQSLRIREVTVESLQMMLTGAAAPLPDATKGTNSETARLAMQAMKGQIAIEQAKSVAKPIAPPIAVPQTEVVQPIAGPLTVPAPNADPIRAAIAPKGPTESIGVADLMGAAAATEVAKPVPAALRLS